MRLIDRLIALWNMWECYEQYYLHELAPKLLEYETATRLSVDEKRIARELKRLLSPEEWQRLPELIASRRNKTLDSIGSDMVRSQAELEARRLAYEAATIEEERRREQDRQRRLAESVRAAELLRSLEQERREKEERARAQENQRRLDEQRKRELENDLAEIFQSDFLYADHRLAHSRTLLFLQHSEYQKLKSGFVEKWARETLHQELDDEQAAAIANTQGNTLVVARAGSGKTRTLVTRALFLQKHCGVSANEMLLVAFNKVAAEEVKERLKQTLGSSVPHVMTFHALAHALVHPEERIVYDDLSADQLGHSRLVQAVIDTHIHSRDYSSQIRELMLGYFREDWERIVAGGYDLDMDEFLAQRRSLTSESLRGDYVKSFGEKVIANALFEFGVDYQYESNFLLNGVNYRPDFKIPLDHKKGIIIEYFGLRGEPDYDKMSDEKRRYWSSKKGWILLEYHPSDITGQVPTISLIACYTI